MALMILSDRDSTPTEREQLEEVGVLDPRSRRVRTQVQGEGIHKNLLPSALCLS